MPQVNGGKETFGITFTSIHSTPTGWQNLYVFANESKPIQFTQPHSGNIPKGAVTTGFGSTKRHFGLNQGGGLKEKWKACPVPEAVAEGTWQIYWDGSKTKKLGPHCVDIRLKIGKTKECRLPH